MTEKKKENGMTRREFVKTVGAAAVVGSALSMSVPKEAHAARTLKIGFMGPFTGPASRTGDQFKRGIKMALEDAETNGEIPVKVEIKRNFNTQYWKLANNGEYGDFEKVDLNTVKYTLVLEPRSTKSFEYVLRTYHGAREEDWRP